MVRPARWGRALGPAVLLVLWLLGGTFLAPYVGKVSGAAPTDTALLLPRDAESARVQAAGRALGQKSALPLTVVWTTTGVRGDVPDRISASQRRAATAALARLGSMPGLIEVPSAPMRAPDGRAMQSLLLLEPDLGTRLPSVVEDIRRSADRVPGIVAALAGPAAIQADLDDAFARVDGLLLVVSLIGVLVVLLIVYRSLLLPLLIVVGAVCSLIVACTVVYLLARQGVVQVDGQLQGILFVLVIGAATDYGLLLAARYSEELGADDDRCAAMRTALRRSAGPITASAATVCLGLLALLLGDLPTHQALGPVSAIGIVCAVLSSLTFLPAALLLFGRAAYWPSQDATGRKGSDRLWTRIAGSVDRAPRRIWVTTLAGLLACAAFAPTLATQALSLDQIFRGPAPAVNAQAALSRHFPAGIDSPAVVITNRERLQQVTEAVRSTPGVATTSRLGQPAGSAASAEAEHRRLALAAILDDPPDSDAAQVTITNLREAVHKIPGAEAEVGGYSAQQLDTQQTADRDRTLIVPVVLASILLVLMILLRCLLMPILLMATVALNYLATLGIAALVFDHVLGFTSTDPTIGLYAFVFLVALGVDYNIFLVARVREEAVRHGPRPGLLRGLTATGGVISSAGIVLAATFAALTVIPVVYLFQIGFIVAVGVLLDTLIVRSLLVPALIREIGPTVWWPNTPSSTATPAAEPPALADSPEPDSRELIASGEAQRTS
ncbi:MMPL family transporter [Streptomyces sp. NPDC058685]|uniref:MMPL family transporter n=1 Tax=Streptomyces sp. NPDC058685 TaxID=3346598 RepID=UPI00364E3B1F